MDVPTLAADHSTLKTREIMSKKIKIKTREITVGGVHEIEL